MLFPNIVIKKAIISIIFIILISFTFYFIVKGDLRNYILFFLILSLFIFFFFQEKIIIALLIVTPFIGLLRRLMYIFSPYSRIDLLNILSDIFVIIFFFFIILVKRIEILKNIKKSNITKLYTILFLIMFIQIFNPYQGSVLIGLGGAKFWLIPMLWFYFALLFDNEDRVKNILNLILVVGFICALYGIKQGIFGFADFERKWVYAKMDFEKFRSITIHSFIRPISTFTSPQEYGDYILIAFLISSGFFLKRIGLSLYFFAMIIIFYAAITEGIRGVIIMLFFGLLFQIFVFLRDKRLAIMISFIFILSYFLLTSIISITSFYHSLPIDISRVYYHVIKGLLDPFSVESTIWERIGEFLSLSKMLSRYPFGIGLGTTSLAAWKFGGRLIGFEIPFFTFIITSSIIGGIIYLIIIILSLKNCYIYYKRTLNPIYVIIFSVILTYFIIGGLTLYSTTSIYWFLIGISSRKFSRIEK